MHHQDVNETHGEKARWELHKNTTHYFEQILEAAPHKTIGCAHTYLLSHKPYKSDEKDMRGTAGEVRTNS